MNRKTDIRDDIVAIVSDVKQSQILPADYGRPLKEIAIDSLDIANILLAAEEKFGIKIPDEDVDRLTTIDAITDYVQSHAAG